MLGFVTPSTHSRSAVSGCYRHTDEDAPPQARERCLALATYLDRILEHHRSLAAADTRPVDSLIADAKAAEPGRGFRDALAQDPTMSVIAEIKRRSPSKGSLRLDLNAASLAQSYLAGGATSPA